MKRRAFVLLVGFVLLVVGFFQSPRVRAWANRELVHRVHSLIHGDLHWTRLSWSPFFTRISIEEVRWSEKPDAPPFLTVRRIDIFLSWWRLKPGKMIRGVRVLRPRIRFPLPANLIRKPTTSPSSGEKSVLALPRITIEDFGIVGAVPHRLTLTLAHGRVYYRPDVEGERRVEIWSEWRAHVDRNVHLEGMIRVDGRAVQTENWVFDVTFRSPAGLQVMASIQSTFAEAGITVQLSGRISKNVLMMFPVTDAMRNRLIQWRIRDPRRMDWRILGGLEGDRGQWRTHVRVFSDATHQFSLRLRVDARQKIFGTLDGNYDYVQFRGDAQLEGGSNSLKGSTHFHFLVTPSRGVVTGTGARFRTDIQAQVSISVSRPKPGIRFDSGRFVWEAEGFHPRFAWLDGEITWVTHTDGVQFQTVVREAASRPLLTAKGRVMPDTGLMLHGSIDMERLREIERWSLKGRKMTFQPFQFRFRMTNLKRPRRLHVHYQTRVKVDQWMVPISGRFEVRHLERSRPDWMVALQLVPSTGGVVDVRVNGEGRELLFTNWVAHMAASKLELPLPKAYRQKGLRTVRVRRLTVTMTGYGVNLKKGDLEAQGRVRLGPWGVSGVMTEPVALDWNLAMVSSGYTHLTGQVQVHEKSGSATVAFEWYPVDRKGVFHVQGRRQRGQLWGAEFIGTIFRGTGQFERDHWQYALAGRVKEIRWRGTELGEAAIKINSPSQGEVYAPEFTVTLGKLGVTVEGEVQKGKTAFRVHSRIHAGRALLQVGSHVMTYHAGGELLAEFAPSAPPRIRSVRFHVDQFEWRVHSRRFITLERPIRLFWDGTDFQYAEGRIEVPGGRLNLGMNRKGAVEARLSGRLRPLFRSLKIDHRFTGRLRNVDAAYELTIRTPKRDWRRSSVKFTIRDLSGIPDMTQVAPCRAEWRPFQSDFRLGGCEFTRLRGDGVLERHRVEGRVTEGGQWILKYWLDHGAPGEWVTGWIPEIPWILLTSEERGFLSMWMEIRWTPTWSGFGRFAFLMQVNRFQWSTPYGDLSLARPLRVTWDPRHFETDFRSLRVNEQPIPIRVLVDVRQPPLPITEWFQRENRSHLIIRAIWDGSFDTGPLLAPFGTFLDGRIEGRMMAEGPLDHPLVVGQLKIEKARLWDRDYSIRLKKIEGLLDVEGIERVRLKVQGEGSQGTWRIEGEGGWSPHVGRFHWKPVIISMSDLVILSPMGWRVRLNGSLRLDRPQQEFRLTGKIDVSEFEYFAPFNFASALRGAEAKTIRWWERLPLWLDIHVRVRRTLISNNLAELVGAGEWAITGKIDGPTLAGQWTLTEAGFLLFQNVPYRVDHVQLLWSAEQEWTNPRLDMSLATLLEPPPGEETNLQVQVKISGTVESPRLTLTSEPPLSEPEILTVLTTGGYFSSSEASVAPADLGRAMVFSLGGSISRSLLQPVTGLIGITDISLRPVVTRLEQGEDIDPTARLNIRRPIRSWVATTFSMDVRNTANQDWILDVQPTSWTRLRVIRSLSAEGRSWILGFRGQFTLPFRRFTTPWSFRRPRPRKYRMNTVEIRGAWPWPRKATRKLLGIQPGGRVELTELNDRIARVEQMIRRMGYYQAMIQWTVEPLPGGGSKLGVELWRGPRFRLEVDSTLAPRISSDEQWPIIKVCFQPFMPHRLIRSCLKTRFLALLEQKMYRLDRLQVAEATHGGTRIFRVRATGIQKVGRYRVEWTGDPWIAEPTNREYLIRVCRESLGLRVTVPPGWMLWRGRRFCIARWRDALEQQGLKPRHLAITFAFQSETQPVIKVRVDLGQPVIKTVTFEGLPQGFHVEGMETFKGNVFIPDRVRTRVDRICRRLRDRGYPEARCDFVWKPSAHELRITFRPGPQAVVGEVVWPNVFLRRWGSGLTGIRSGVVWTPALRQQATARLRRLELFRSVRFETEKMDERGRRRIRVLVEPSPILQINTGIREDTETGPEVELFGWLRERWIWGTTFFGGAQLGTDVRRYRMGVVFPHLFTRDVYTQFYYLDERLDEGGFITREKSLTFEQNWRIGRHLTWTYRFNTRQVRVTEKETVGPFRFDFATRINRLSTDFRYDTRDSVLDPHHGVFALVTVEYAPTVLGGEIGFIKGFTQFAYHAPLGKRWVLAGDIRLGLARAFEGSLIRSERFFIGGATSFRGADFHALGPRDPFTGVFRGGEAMVLGNLELRFYPLHQFSVAGFLDIGNVYDRVDDLSLNDLHEATGLGLRWLSPFGLLRVDWGYRLDPLTDERRSRFYFAFGHIF